MWGWSGGVGVGRPGQQRLCLLLALQLEGGAWGGLWRDGQGRQGLGVGGGGRRGPRGRFLGMQGCSGGGQETVLGTLVASLGRFVFQLSSLFIHLQPFLWANGGTHHQDSYLCEHST